MRTSAVAALVLIGLWPLKGLAAIDDAAGPDESTVREQVNQLIRTFHDEKRKVTPGMIQQAISLSISFGAPAWNRGDHGACARFYLTTAQSLVGSFGAKDAATGTARGALEDLQFAIDRAQTYKDDDRSAWSLRFAFDKNQMNCELAVQKAQSLVALGEQYLKRSQYQESEDALRSAVTALAELDGEELDSIPPAARYAPLALVNVLFAQRRFDEASAQVLKGLVYLPQWPAVQIDLREASATPEDYKANLEALEMKARSEPDNASTQFLLGYQYWFTGRRLDAKDQFHQTLKLDPHHAGAALFLDPEAGKTGPPKPRA